MLRGPRAPQSKQSGGGGRRRPLAKRSFPWDDVCRMQPRGRAALGRVCVSGGALRIPT